MNTNPESVSACEVLNCLEICERYLDAQHGKITASIENASEWNIDSEQFDALGDIEALQTRIEFLSGHTDCCDQKILSEIAELFTQIAHFIELQLSEVSDPLQLYSRRTCISTLTRCGAACDIGAVIEHQHYYSSENEQDEEQADPTPTSGPSSASGNSSTHDSI